MELNLEGEGVLHKDTMKKTVQGKGEQSEERGTRVVGRAWNCDLQ